MAFTPTPRKKIALDSIKLKMSAPNGDGNNRATLSWGLTANNPRLVVYTNVESDKTERTKNGQILAALDAPTFFVLLEMIERAINSTTEFKQRIENKNHIFIGGKRSDEPMVQSEIWVGKDADGTVWMSVVAFQKERPRIKFVFGPSLDNTGKAYHEYYHADGTPMTKAEKSVMYAQAYVKLLEPMMAHLLCTEYEEPKPFEKKGGGGSGGGNYGGGNRGGSAPAASNDFDSADSFF